MDGVIRRRDMIYKGGATPQKPYPYSINDWTNGAGGTNAALTNWNNIAVSVVTTRTNVGIWFNFLDGNTVEGTNPGTSPTYMTFPSGASVSIYLKNISNPNSMPIEMFATTGGSNTKISSFTLARFTNSSDQSVSATMGADTTIGGIWLYCVRTGRTAGNSFSCDLEVYVNSVRWI